MPRIKFFIFLYGVLLIIGNSYAFHSTHRDPVVGRDKTLRLNMFPGEQNHDDNDNDGNSNNNSDGTNHDRTKSSFCIPMSGFWETSDIHKQLKGRRMDIHDGIGKRYMVRTREGGPLNVHLEPSSAFATDNIVNQLTDRQIVTSTGPTRGVWIQHDGGGWSVSNHQGFTWLEPIDE